MNDELEGIERKGRNLIQILSRHLPVGDEEDHEKSVRITVVQAEIRT
jgi:hypothetical protein